MFAFRADVEIVRIISLFAQRNKLSQVAITKIILVNSHDNGAIFIPKKVVEVLAVGLPSLDSKVLIELFA